MHNTILEIMVQLELHVEGKRKLKTSMLSVAWCESGVSTPAACVRGSVPSWSYGEGEESLSEALEEEQCVDRSQGHSEAEEEGPLEPTNQSPVSATPQDCTSKTDVKTNTKKWAREGFLGHRVGQETKRNLDLSSFIFTSQ